MLFVHGGPTTAVVRGSTGESVVLLSGELPEILTEGALTELLDLAAAVLDEEELKLFRRCLDALVRGEGGTPRRIELDGVVLSVYED
ncbi:hypothetical protein SO3561_00118 [Streptomyces olivochromogenes]|uniref:Uncharacterized protein n=1 Tax=Streptomyces olivochromogenes TaxID=1963 RepID=A0A250V363_STROL|nr:hypothetical protein SO3561_00118 [Streptomyces olivochromogenes]